MLLKSHNGQFVSSGRRDVGQLLDSWDVSDEQPPCLDHVGSNIVVAYIDVLYLIKEIDVLAQGNCSVIVAPSGRYEDLDA